MPMQTPLRVFPSQKAMFDRLLAMPLSQRLLQPIEVIPFSTRVYAFCFKQKIKTLGQLCGWKRKDLATQPNMGLKTLEHLEIYLAAAGISLNGCWDHRLDDVPEEWIKGAEAMRKIVLLHLHVHKVEPQIRDSIKRLPIPTPTEMAET